MKNDPSLQIPNTPLETVLGEAPLLRRGALAWWFHLTSLSPSSAQSASTRRGLRHVSVDQSDLIRRSWIASAESLYYTGTLLMAALVAAFGPNKQIFTIIIPSLICIAFGLLLNRLGKVNWAGIVLSAGIALSMWWSVLTAPGGLSLLDTQILFLLLFSDMFWVVILPLKVCWVPALLNLIFSVVTFSFAHHSPALTAQLPIWYFPTLFRLVQIHLVATGVPVILVGIMRHLIQRAANAEEVARLQHHLQEEARRQLQDKYALEASLQMLITVHTQVANGDLQARVPLVFSGIKICTKRY